GGPDRPARIKEAEEGDRERQDGNAEQEEAEHDEEAPVTECSAARPWRIGTVERRGAPTEVVQEVPLKRGYQEYEPHKERRAYEPGKREPPGRHAQRLYAGVGSGERQSNGRRPRRSGCASLPDDRDRE